MQLWLIRPVDDRSTDGDDPWDPWYDKAFGFVVRAATEAEARQFAHSNAGDENRGEFLGSKIANTTAPWLDGKYSTCEPLSVDGAPGVIIQDFHSA